VFRDGRTVVLNHPPTAAKAHPNHIPKNLRVWLKGHVCGEDDPLYSERLERDGWKLRQEWQVGNRGYPQLFRTLQAEFRHKLSPDRRLFLQLTRSIERFDYSEEFSLGFTGAEPFTKIERASWADWDQQGRLVFARDGRLFSAQIMDRGGIAERELANFNPSRPVALPSPLWAQAW
jgi:hypothetical protein